MLEPTETDGDELCVGATETVQGVVGQQKQSKVWWGHWRVAAEWPLPKQTRRWVRREGVTAGDGAARDRNRAAPGIEQHQE